MLTQDPVKIPDIPKRIRLKEKDGHQYVQYLAGRPYDADKRHNVPNWVNIGKRIETMPRLMYPNDNYEKYFCGEDEQMEENMTAEEAQYVQDNGTYGLYAPFFTGLYNEFKQQTRKKADEPVNRYKAESINKVLLPLKEMMKGEEYAELLGLISTAEDGEESLNYGDVMILLTQYKSALTKYHRNHP